MSFRVTIAFSESQLDKPLFWGVFSVSSKHNYNTSHVNINHIFPSLLKVLLCDSGGMLHVDTLLCKLFELLLDVGPAWMMEKQMHVQFA